METNVCRHIIKVSLIWVAWMHGNNCLPVVPEKSHTHPMEGHWKFLGEGGCFAEFSNNDAFYNNLRIL